MQRQINDISLSRYNQVKTLGFYEPSAFHIHHIGCGHILDWKRWPDNELCTLFHEYIHFMQDLTTVQGLFNMYLEAEYMKGISQVVSRSADKKIKVPINPLDMPYNIDNNFRINRIGIGDIANNIAKVKSYCSTYDTIAGIKMRKIILNAEKKDGRFVQFEFGASVLMENMAKLLENIMFRKERDWAPQCPYHTAEEVADLIYPTISNDKMVIIALCDYALQSSLPGKVFVEYLENKKNAGIPLNVITVESIYDELQNTFTVSSIPNSQNDFASNYKQRVKFAFDSLTCYDTNGLFPQFKQYFSNILGKGSMIRLQMPMLFIDMAIMGDIRNNKIFQMLLDNFGTPLVTNNNYDKDFISPKGCVMSEDDMMNVYAYSQIYKAFRMKRSFLHFLISECTYCDLYQICKKHYKEFRFRRPCGIRCRFAPWKNVMNRRLPCYYGRWWHWLALREVRFVRRW